MKTVKKVVFYIALAGIAWLAAQLFVRPGMDSYRATLAQPAEENVPLKVTWFGVATVLIDDGNHRLLIDPFFTRSSAFITLLNLPVEPKPRLAKAWLEKAGVSSVDAVLVSHSHYDHILDIGELGDTAVYGSETSKNISLGHGVATDLITTIQTDTPYSIGPYTVTFIATPHAGATGGRPQGELTEPLATPSRPWNYKLGGTYSIHIAHPKGNLLHVGSAGITPGALKKFEASTVLLGSALRPPLKDYLDATVYAVGATTIIPIHWDDFFQPLSTTPRPLAFGAKLDELYNELAHNHPQLKVISAPIGQPINPFVQ